MEWLSRKTRWAAENPLFWWNLALVLAAVAVVLIWPSPKAGDFRVKTLGMALQLLGVVSVWLDLTATAREFGKGGVLKRTWKWLQRGLGGGNVIVAATGNALAAFTGRARAKVRHSINSSASLPDRVAGLEQLVGQVDADLDGAYREIDHRVSEVNGQLAKERSARESSISDVKRSLERAAAGNYSTLLFGAAWLFVGVVLSTWAPEIAKLVADQLDWSSL
jgi:hypothetical protein